MVARAGQEQFPGLNDSIDRFFAKALALNRPITLVNHPTVLHAFDLVDDSAASRRIIRQVLDFLTAQLTPPGCPDLIAVSFLYRGAAFLRSEPARASTVTRR